jgi:autotransporter strand-loop-strand O-heptosyltransferase
MAHKQQRDFCIKVKERYTESFKNKKVLDIGSLDINGSNRFLFEDCEYIGLDVGEGNNVDVVSVGHLYDGPDNYFDTIISTEVFEHDMFYEDTIKNIIRMLKPGGLFLFTCAANGRPEHGTKRTSQCDAPLLINVSDEWSDYYKNLEKEDIKKIPSFNETFIDGYFERGHQPDDLYFCGIKGGNKFYNNVKPEFPKEQFKDDIFVIDSWPNTESKENDLIELINILKIYNIPILLTGHYPIKPEIQNMVDYYIFDKNNPLLVLDEYESHEVASGRWTEMPDYNVNNSMEFHHDYAIWETMRNTFNFCNYLGKKNIHFLEYDNLPNKVQYRQTFLERINQFDAVLYEYTEGSTKTSHLDPYCATFLFSIKTEVALKVINQINSKGEYFRNKPKGWQLERVFLKCLKEVTNKIHISDYIANDNELNTQAVWNRDGMDRNGATFQVYLAADDYNNLYVHVISGFFDVKATSDYLIEVNYKDLKKFFNLKKDSYLTEKIGKYSKGERVKIYYQGVEVFNEFLGYDVNKFKKLNKITHKNIKIEPKISINLIDGPYVEITDDFDKEYVVNFIDKDTNNILHTSKIKNGWWTKSSIQYYKNWKIKINSENFEKEYDIDLTNKNILISFESKSFGDNIAWIPYVEKFRVENKCNVICSTFHNDLFRDGYPEIKFIEPGSTVNDVFGVYRIGLFKNDNKFDITKHPSDPKKEPLTKIASDILGLEYVELKPKVPKLGTGKKKMVSIAIHSTAQCKYWNNPTGWQDVVDFLNEKGYEVRLLSKEEDGYMGNKNPKGVIVQPQSSVTEILKVIQESELFIGISSGLSWLSWASETPTILISGFTDKYLEPINGINRIINKDVCNGCWHDYEFDPGDWNWCPVNKGTDKQFECSKKITSKDVIDEIKKILN